MGPRLAITILVSATAVAPACTEPPPANGIKDYTGKSDWWENSYSNSPGRGTAHFEVASFSSAEHSFGFARPGPVDAVFNNFLGVYDIQFGPAGYDVRAGKGKECPWGCLMMQIDDVPWELPPGTVVDCAASATQISIKGPDTDDTESLLWPAQTCSYRIDQVPNPEAHQNTIKLSDIRARFVAPGNVNDEAISMSASLEVTIDGQW